MAVIGMRHVVAAKVATETTGTALTYSTGMVVGKAITGNLTWNVADNPLYADDAIAENDNGVLGGTLEIGVDDLSDAVKAYLMGDDEITGGSGNDAYTEYETNDEPAPYVGLGYIRVRMKNNETSYQAVWYHKAMFMESSENTTTKGENIEWQTPTLNGTIFGVHDDASGKAHYRRRRTFDTMAAAVTWLNGKAGIS